MHPLDEVEAAVRRYLLLPASHHYPAVALWAAHTYGFTRWDSTPRIAFMAPEKDCGKSRALELLEALCASARIVSGRAGISLAGIRQYICAADAPTILVDEIDTVFGAGVPTRTCAGSSTPGTGAKPASWSGPAPARKARSSIRRSRRWRWPACLPGHCRTR
jgi:hypothetical protein